MTDPRYPDRLWLNVDVVDGVVMLCEPVEPGEEMAVEYERTARVTELMAAARTLLSVLDYEVPSYLTGRERHAREALRTAIDRRQQAEGQEGGR